MKQIEQTKEIIDAKNLSGGLEILVQLAEKGDIDPWDIDIIDITDKYLSLLDKSPRENLLNAGRTIFFASVLLRLKSEILLNISNETLLSCEQTENFFPEDELLFQEDGLHLDLSKLEGYIIRSSLGKNQRKRRISLNDLITALKQAEEEEERRTIRAKLKAQNAYTIIADEIPENILDISQDDDIEEVVEKVEAIIEEHLTSEKPITLSFLAEILNNKLKPFLALLFLAQSQKVVLEQIDFYGEVHIHKAGTVLKEEEQSAISIQHSAPIRQGKRKPIDTLPHKKPRATKVIEVISDGKEVIDINVRPLEEMITDGNNPTQ
jgi:segregation and condensation protein A